MAEKTPTRRASTAREVYTLFSSHNIYDEEIESTAFIVNNDIYGYRSCVLDSSYTFGGYL